MAAINAKIDTIPRFNSIQNIWVGAEYLPASGKWKWRNSHAEFRGNLTITICPRILNLQNGINR